MSTEYLDLLINIASSEIPSENKIGLLINELEKMKSSLNISLIRSQKNKIFVFNKNENRWEYSESLDLSETLLNKMREISKSFFSKQNYSLKELLNEKNLLMENHFFAMPVFPNKLDDMTFIIGSHPKGKTISWEEINGLAKAISLALGFIHDEISTKLAIREMKKVIKELEKTYSKIPDFRKELDPKLKISPSQIQEICPVAFVGCMDEEIGPRFVVSHPMEFNKMENLFSVVNSYSSIDFEQVINIGHVFSSISTTKPSEGELLGLYFVIPNPEARGGYELHSIHILISKPYENAMVYGSLEMRALLFQAREEYLQEYENLRESIITGNPSESEMMNFQKKVYEILGSLKKDISRFILGVLFSATKQN